MRVNGRMESVKDLESIYGLIEATMKGSGMRTKLMERASLFMLTETYTMECGQMTWLMGQACIYTVV